jgi:hypothetical protein
MDPLGLLLAVVAVAVYPGGLFLAALGWLTRWAGGLPPATRLDTRTLAAIVAATLAASMASLPGSPAASLPPPGGATPNLVAAVLLLFVAGALAAPGPWSFRRLALLGLGGVSMLLLGLLAASFSIPSLAGVGGAGADAARILATITTLTALPLVVQPHLSIGAVTARVTVVAATVEVVLSTLIPPSLPWKSATLIVVALVAAAGIYAVLLRVGRAATQREHPSLVAFAAACCAAATVVAVLAARP